MIALSQSDATTERIGGHDERYFDADGCSSRYGFSRRHWLRLVDSGRAPQPTRFGRLCRWPLTRLAAWEADNCRPVRAAARKRGAR